MQASSLLNTGPTLANSHGVVLLSILAVGGSELGRLPMIVSGRGLSGPRLDAVHVEEERPVERVARSIRNLSSGSIFFNLCKSVAAAQTVVGERVSWNLKCFNLGAILEADAQAGFSALDLDPGLWTLDLRLQTDLASSETDAQVPHEAIFAWPDAARRALALVRGAGIVWLMGCHSQDLGGPETWVPAS